jgi:hypothetical protein
MYSKKVKHLSEIYNRYCNRSMYRYSEPGKYKLETINRGRGWLKETASRKTR